MERSVLSRSSCALLFGLICVAGSAWAQTSRQITIHAPEAETYELALDEVELSPARGEWRGQQTLFEVGGARLSTRRSTAAVFEATADSRDAVAFVARALEDANPDSRANLVLYVAGKPRSAGSRRVLTREVGVMLRDGADAGSFLDAQRAFEPRAVDGLSNAFVLTALDPLGAVDLADALRDRADIAHAYPLLRQQRALR